MKAVLVTLAALFAAFSSIALAGQPAFSEAQVDAAMAKADADGNGVVGLSEARRFGITMDTFRKANPDRDGSLDRNEFAAALREQYAASQSQDGAPLDWRGASRAGIRSKKIFEAADPDGDRHLDLAEYLSAMTAQAK